MKIGIIGAGISGLASALKAKKMGIDFKIFDGNSEVGGRLYNKDLPDGSIIELGGQWFNQNHTEVKKLIDELNLMTFSTISKMDFNDLFQREMSRGLDRDAFKAIVNELCDYADQLDLNDLMSHNQAATWDAIDFNEWIMQRTNSQIIKESVNVLINWHFSNFQVDNTSLLNVLFFIKSNNAIDYLREFSPNLNEQRIVGGLALLAKKLGRIVGKENIELKTQVTKIEHLADKVIVHTTHGSHEFDEVILSVAPEMIKEINFEPDIPKKYHEFYDSFAKTKVYKFSFTYENKFWTGSGFMLKTDGFISKSVENTTVMNRDYVYVGFVIGDKKDLLLENDIETRKNILLNEIRELFGSDEALHYTDFSEYNWKAKMFKDGYYISKLGINGWNRFANIWGKPYGRINFSGTENSKTYNGYVEGAVQRGYEVIDEIIKKHQKAEK